MINKSPVSNTYKQPDHLEVNSHSSEYSPHSHTLQIRGLEGTLQEKESEGPIQNSPQCASGRRRNPSQVPASRKSPARLKSAGPQHPTSGDRPEDCQDITTPLLKSRTAWARRQHLLWTRLDTARNHLGSPTNVRCAASLKPASPKNPTSDERLEDYQDLTTRMGESP